MRKSNILLLFLAIFGLSTPGHTQIKAEREFRIKKSQFPEEALSQIDPYLNDARRIRFYKEIDSSRNSYKAKFKKRRLHYSVEFTPQGQLEGVEFIIKEIDIPSESYAAMHRYLSTNFDRFRIRKMQQQYPVSGPTKAKKIVKEAFQNLLLPYLNYEIIVAAKEDSGYQDFEILFDHEGNFIKMRKSLPPNYDHVLY